MVCQKKKSNKKAWLSVFDFVKHFWHLFCLKINEIRDAWQKSFSFTAWLPNIRHFWCGSCQAVLHCRICWLDLCWGVNTPTHDECPDYDAKSSDGEAPVAITPRFTLIWSGNTC